MLSIFPKNALYLPSIFKISDQKSPLFACLGPLNIIGQYDSPHLHPHYLRPDLLHLLRLLHPRHPPVR